MAYGKPYLFYLINPDTGDFYTWTRTAGIQQTGTPTPIRFAPEEWQTTEIKFTRSNKYWGLFRNFALPYNFVEDGREIVKHIYDTQGVTGKCKMLLQQQISTDGTYFDYYEGMLDFKFCKPSKTGVTITITEGGLVDMIDNNMDIPYEIPIDPLDSDLLLMDGIKMQETQHYIGTATSQPTTNEDEVPLPLAFVSQDGEYVMGDGGTVFPGIGAGHQYYVIFTSLRTQDLTFEVKESITFSNDGSSADPALPKISIFIYATLEAAVAGSPVNFIDTDLWVAGAPLNPGDTQSYTIDQSYFYTLSPGNIVVITAHFSIPTPSGSSSGSIDIADGGSLDIFAEFITDSSYVSAYRYSQLWAKIIAAMTGSVYTGTSPYLIDIGVTPDTDYGNIPWSTLVTCGDAIRGLANPVIKTTPTDVFKNASDIWNLYLATDLDSGEAILKPLSEILDSATEIVDLGEVSGLTYEPADDLMGNVIDFGYASHDSKTLNGRQEFNVDMKFTTPLSNVKAVLDWKCNYYSGMFDIEQVRNNISQKTTSDATQDNDIYVIESAIDLDTGIVTLQRLQNTGGHSAGGIVYPDYGYNFGITPKRNLLRKRGMWDSVCNQHAGEYLIFQTNERNKEVITDLDTNGNIAEKNNEIIGTRRLFNPTYFNFTSRIPKNLIALVNANPYGYLSFKWLGVRCKAFPWEIGIYPATNGAYQVKALCHPDFDTADLP